MRYRRQIFTILFITVVIQLQAQQTCKLHIVTIPGNQMQGFNFQFEVNGVPHKLKPGQCLELVLTADSVHIIMEEKRWPKKEKVNLHAKATDDLYVRIFWGWKPNQKKKLICFAEAICKSCFDEYKEKCKKELTE